MYFWTKEVCPEDSELTLSFSGYFSGGTKRSFFNRPHDRVPLKEMKADWHSCLDSKVGFKVVFKFVFN